MPLGPDSGPVTNWGDYYARQSRSITGSGSFPWPRATGPSSPVLPGRTAAQVEREARITALEAEASARSELGALLKKESSLNKKKKKLETPKNPLLDFEAEQRRIQNPELERIMAQEVGGSKKSPGPKSRRPKQNPKSFVTKAAQLAAARLAAKVVSRFVPGVGQLQTVADVATVAVSVVEELQNAAMEKALGPSVMPGYKEQSAQGPRTRVRARTRTQRQPAATLPSPQQTVLGTAIQAPGTATASLPKPNAPLPTAPQATGPVPRVSPSSPGRTKNSPQPGGKAQATPSPSVSFSFDPLGYLADKFGPRLSRPGLPSVGTGRGTATRKPPKGNPYAPLTGTQIPGVGCACPPAKKDQKSKRKKRAREVCYAGTYIERAKGLSKRKKRKVPCR